MRNAGTYYMDYNAGPQVRPPRSNATVPEDETAFLQQPNKPPSQSVIDDSPSPPPADVHSSSSFRHLPGPLAFPTAWRQSHSGRNFGNMAHRVLASEPDGNFAKLTGPSSHNEHVDMLYNTDNKRHSACHQSRPYNETLPSFAQVYAEVNRHYIRDRDTDMPGISDGQSGFYGGPLMHSGREDTTTRNIGDQFLRHAINKQPDDVSAQPLPSLHGGRLLEDNHNAPNFNASQSTRTDPTRRQSTRGDVNAAVHPSPHSVRLGHRFDMGNVTDQQILGILESNPTIVNQFQNACSARLQQYKQSLDNAYNQRLAEIEEYTRKWRDHTRELWQATSAGQVRPVDVSQRAALAWQGPHEMAKSAEFHLPTIDTRFGEPVFNENTQAISGAPIPYVPTPAAQSSASAAPPAPGYRPHLRVQPSHHQRRQVGLSPPPTGASRSSEPLKFDRLLPDAQIAPGIHALPNQPFQSSASISRPIFSHSDAFQTAHGQSTPSQPDTSSQSALRHIASSEPALTQHFEARYDLSQPSSPQTAAPQAPQRQLLCPEWIKNFEGYVKDASGKYTSNSHRLLTLLSTGELGPSFTSILKLSYSAILLALKSSSNGYDYRRFDHLTMKKSRACTSEVIVELSEANVLMFGKAFCYIKERRARMRSEVGLSCGRRMGVEGEVHRMYEFFSQQAINGTLNTMRQPKRQRRGVVSRDLVHEPRHLLIARPKHKDGRVTGATHFDIGSEQPFTRIDREWHIVASPGFLQASTSNDGASPKDSQAQDQGRSLDQLARVDSQLRWDKWVKVIQGTPDTYLRIEVEKNKRCVEMGSHKYPITPEVARDLGIPTKQKFWFKSTTLKDMVQYFDLGSASMVINPVISGQDVVIQWTASNVLIFWKTFCLVKERMDRLLALQAQGSGKSPDTEPPASHERLVRYYRDFLAKEDRQAKLHSISLSIGSWDEEGIPVFDINSRGSLVERRLILLRSQRKNDVIDKATTEFFDVGMVSPIEGKPKLADDIIIPENSVVGSRIADLLLKSIHMDMFPNLNNLGSPLDPLPMDTVKNASCSPYEDDSASWITSAQLNVPGLTESSTAPSLLALPRTSLVKRVLDYSTDMRRSGLSLLTKASADQMVSSSPSQPSPSLIAAVPRSGLGVAVKKEVAPELTTVPSTQNQAREVIIIYDSSEDENEGLMDTAGPSETVALRSGKHPARDIGDEARYVKRTRLMDLESDVPHSGVGAIQPSSVLSWKTPSQQSQPAQLEPSSTPSDVRATMTTPRETDMIPITTGVDVDLSKSSDNFEGRAPAAFVVGTVEPMSEQTLARATGYVPVAPGISHRATTAEPEETSKLPFARGADIDRPKSTGALGYWRPVECMVDQPEYQSEQEESSYVTAAEDGD
ncbi:hypothetical protein N0V82_007366 [Gnomoniopsis sp. IMI 355080]|nr:hypothetical protein N0V82_007366 [Gnomoniopsis sp. IMI 355080]